jgi:hypothetical protein
VSAATVLPVDAAEVVAGVPDREYRRLLGLPPGRAWPDAMAARASEARQWYALHGRPFIATRRLALDALGENTVSLETGAVLASEVLAERLRTGEAHALVVLAASAGPEVAEEARRRWNVDRPDEGYFLDRLAAVITERLVFHAATAVCSADGGRHEWPLPHLSPGCGRWDLADQHRLMALLIGLTPGQDAAAAGKSCGPVILLESGMLEPQHSLLAALGVTHLAHVATAEASCRSCDLDPCDYRRVPSTEEILRRR